MDDSINIQYFYLGFTGVLFLFGAFTNLCSFCTFIRPKPRKLSVGNYLLIVSILNTCAIFCLFIELIQSLGFTSDVSCKISNYLLSVFTRCTYWLTTWITIDRLRTSLSPMNTTLKNPGIAIFFSIISLVLLFVMDVHELIVFKQIKQFDSSKTHCVIDLTQPIIATYNRISTICHYIIPFLVQAISISLLILFIARSRAKTTGHKLTFRQVLMKQFYTQKELYITPTIIVLSALPQIILSTVLACNTELSNSQRHLLRIGYLLAFTPQALGFILYVLPSTEYTKEFSQTFLGKNLLKNQ
ncbi:unnamed protein product [Adineta ricciae]|uniref:G-protein coupled receptors family 1 profile domain-containing protein n=1 Tax=Adineta ricciae TaxID=249248 RepID=A0A816G622_ADIRI|nr:unnamed protein product [Adineta ricciae]CAF1670799.1 unnamed protein product [Adineta ricciae]